MGYGNYSQSAHEALLRKRSNIPAEQVFKQLVADDPVRVSKWSSIHCLPQVARIGKAAT